MHISTKQLHDIYINVSQKAVTYLSNPQVLEDLQNTEKPTVFPAFMMLYSISSETSLDKLKLTLRDFLLTQTTIQKTINWWQRNTKQQENEPYPDDLDDTFCTWAAIHETFPESIHSETLAELIKILILNEKDEGGPYSTWVVPKRIKEKHLWSDVDPVVNSNIAFFLSQHDIYLQKVIQYIKESYSKHFSSIYYSSIFPILYFYSRFYKNYYLFTKKNNKRNELYEVSKKAIRTIQTNVHFIELLDLQDTALCISTLSNLVHIKRSSKLFLKLFIHLSDLLENGFTKGNLCIHTNKNGVIKTEGSTYVTAALCIEALKKYSLNEGRKKVNKLPTIIEKSEQNTLTILKEIGGKNSQELLSLFEKLKTSHSFIFTTQLPLHIYAALFSKKHIISEKSLKQLITATMLGWISFTIEDNIIDKDMDGTIYKNIQTILFEKSMILFTTATNRHTKFLEMINKILSRMHKTKIMSDRANMGNEKRYFTYSINKSLGCLLPILGLLCFVKKEKTYIHIKRYITQYYKHIIFVHQLSDDAHDYEEDLSKGKQTLVTNIINKHFCTNKTDIHRNFWTQDIFVVTQMMRKHLKKARKALSFLDLDNQELLTDVEKLEEMVDTTIQEAIHIKDFLSSYKKNGMLNSTHGREPNNSTNR